VDYAAMQRMRSAVNIADLRQCAKMRAHKMVFDYLDSGADDEITLRRAKDAYSELEMHYHVLSGLKPPLDLSTKVFGCDVKLPFFACPTAGNRMFHHEGESAAAKAAQHHGTLYGLSSLGTTSIDDIAKMCGATPPPPPPPPDRRTLAAVAAALTPASAASPAASPAPRPHRPGSACARIRRHSGPKVFQLYVWKDKELVKEVLAKAKKGGFQVGRARLRRSAAASRCVCGAVARRSLCRREAGCSVGLVFGRAGLAGRVSGVSDVD
jgi:isopentenyl diphosphate isomerase/L-lactate dehydrogenase-like FMN-dependent dehydrogenase